MTERFLKEVSERKEARNKQELLERTPKQKGSSRNSEDSKFLEEQRKKGHRTVDLEQQKRISVKDYRKRHNSEQ
jgi:hypothetical protein